MDIDSMFETEQEAGISEPKVMRSNAGYYIGRSMLMDGFEHPYCRLSGYFATREEAEQKIAWF